MRKRALINPMTFLFIATLGIALGWFTRPQSVPAQSSTTSVEKDNEELARLYQEDQSDRQPKDGKPIDWKVVEPRDKVRERRVKELYSTNQLRTGGDYYRPHFIKVERRETVPFGGSQISPGTLDPQYLDLFSGERVVLDQLG